MNPHPPIVCPDDSVLACAALILKAPKTLYLLRVVAGERRLVGIISAGTLLKKSQART